MSSFNVLRRKKPLFCKARRRTRLVLIKLNRFISIDFSSLYGLILPIAVQPSNVHLKQGEKNDFAQDRTGDVLRVKQMP